MDTFYIPTNSAQGFHFLHQLAKAYYFIYLMIAIVIGVRQHLIVVLIWISLAISDIEHDLLCFLALCIIKRGT